MIEWCSNEICEVGYGHDLPQADKESGIGSKVLVYLCPLLEVNIMEEFNEGVRGERTTNAL